MNKKELLLREIESIPDDLLDDLFNYAEFLKTKIARMDTLMASESSFKIEWLEDEEDEAWKKL